MSKKNKKDKKKFLTKKKIIGIALIVGLIYLIPRGGDWFKFLPESIQAYVEIETKDSTSKENTENTKENKENTATNGANQSSTNEVVEDKEISLRMRFIEGVLYIGNWSCPSKDELVKTIEKIRQKYPQKEIRIKYFKNGSDPYNQSYSAQNLLKENNFHITVHAEEQ